MPVNKVINGEIAIKDNVTEIFSNIIIEENKRRNFDFSREVFNSCCLTECDRRILYKSRGEALEITLEFDKIDTQEAIKNKWNNFFSKSIKFSLLDKDVIVADCNYNLKGKIDGVLKIGNANFAVMIKALSEKDFVNAEKNAFRKDVIETMVNMWLLEINDGILIYENKNDNKLSLYHIIPFVQLIEACKKKCLSMLNFKMKGDLPNRPYKNNSSKECSICEFKTKCWEAIS
jgi:hypothetical protein